ncbi:MAG: methyl-accepting chemotaxis protein [Marinobacter sp.]|nr:methyl-accepting chemotaxis protein [Marinobacter sp.]
MFKQLSVAQRLGFGFGLILAFLVTLTLIGSHRVGFIDRTLTTVSEGAAQKQRHAINFRGSVHDRAIAVRDAVLVSSSQALQRHLQDINQLDSFYQESARAMAAMLRELPASATEERLLRAIQQTEARTKALTEEAIRLRSNGSADQAQQFVLQQVSPAYTQWLAEINAFIDYQEDAISADLTAVRNTAGNFQNIIFMLTGLAVLLSIVVATLIIRNLNATLGAEPHEVAEAIRKLSDGILNQQIDTRYPNSVMGTLKDTVAGLAGIIRQVRTAADELKNASVELLDTSDSNNRQIRLQASEAQQMAAAINEMAATVSEVAGYAAQAASATRTADHEVDTGNRVVKETTAAINQLARTLEDAADTVHQVSADSASIEKIIEVINSIAEQTNLLALNAAIEAARAGAHGRGFAVVADEVRSLANRTQESTSEIQDMIGKLQTGANKAAQVMESSRDLARRTVEQTQRAESALEKIRHEVTAINDMNAQIASAAEQQSVVAEEVNQNINRIHDATVETSAGSDQVASSSRELATLADGMDSRVSMFKLAS